MPRTKEQGGPRGRTSEPRASLYWKRGFAYGDFRAWEKWGGRMEPLKPEGATVAATEPTEAAILFGRRLEALRELRSRHPHGLAADELDRLTAFIGFYLASKANRQGRKRATAEWLRLQEVRLIHAARFFAGRGVVKLRELGPADVRAYMEHLQTCTAPRSKGTGGRRGRFSTTTQRRYLDALGEVLQAAVAEGRIERNWVHERTDLPTPEPSPTQHLELPEAALLLEAARRWAATRGERRPVYPFLAFLLLTGARLSEALAVELADVRFPGDPVYPQGVVIIRPTESRVLLGRGHADRLKSEHSVRMVALQPQLAEILSEYLSGPNAPAGPLLFPEPGTHGQQPLGDFRKLLDTIGETAGFKRGELRTRRFRTTFCTHRLCTLDEAGHPMTAWKLRGETGHGSEQMIEARYGRYAKHRARRPMLEYRWDEWVPQMAGRFDEAAQGGPLAASHLVVLAALHRLGAATAKEWEQASGAKVGSFYYARDVLVARALVERDGTRRGSRFRLTAAGRAVLTTREPAVRLAA
jgi:integrase